MLGQDTISNANKIHSDNNEDFSVSDKFEYEPPKKKRQQKFFSQSVELPPLAAILTAQVADHSAQVHLTLVPSTPNLHLAPNVFLICKLYIIIQPLRIFN